MFEFIEEYARNFVAQYGLEGLFLLSFTDSFIQPIPPDLPALAASTALGLNPTKALIVTLIASILGAVVGYGLGKKLGHPLAVKWFGEKKIDRTEKFFEKWGIFGIVLIAFTPIPFKVATWSAGIFEMPFWQFLAASIVGRGTRFAMWAYGFSLLA